ncbi:hypothetical protein [Methylobacterium radiotolerans]|uniref:hypothetical protein n=1 Tax=Methylobacterium radiotolerans TaxID=31998 RepID=UPI0015F476EC|nr:hypothetical protein [Methylobacterium radiotolerans]
MKLWPSTVIRTAAGGAIRWRRVRYVEHAATGGLTAWVAGQAFPLASNDPEVEAELRRLANEHAAEAAARFGGPAEAWTGGTGREGVERALAELAKRQ